MVSALHRLLLQVAGYQPPFSKHAIKLEAWCVIHFLTHSNLTWSAFLSFLTICCTLNPAQL